MDDNDGPYYGGTSPLKLWLLRIWFLITFLAVSIAFILGLVKAKDDPVLYLLVVNLLVSGIIGATIAWWFHKDKIKSQSLCFVLFVGICIVFQAVVSDVYLYHNPNTSSNGDLNPVNVNNASSIISPSTPAQLMAQMTNAIH
ncbi:uncharacterized protein LOC114526980 [Dendronephthya gigantea]|uniref:uncharacterized protein LOC114526980 n=1 Tax=Dendronephthya gigantea TaxID=151771 RepID=UPI00106D1B65|nr:uncharacterized protein LOC114526980 [Dendronephthya gigantea]